MTTAFDQDALQGVALDWFADGDKVTVTPRDKQRFDIGKDRVIDLLQLVDRADKQFELLIVVLGKWISANSAKIAGAHLTLQDGTMFFVVVRKDALYDEQFQDDLAELDFYIANDSQLDTIKLKTLALPNVGLPALLSFVDPQVVFTFYGDRAGPSKSGESESPVPSRTLGRS